MLRTFLCSLLLLLTSLSNASGHKDPELDLFDGASIHRLLQERGCNETLGIATSDQVREVGKLFLEPLVPEGDVDLTRDILFQTAQYDFRVVKLCSSCRFIDIFIYEQEESLPIDWLTYCDESTYGYMKFQSFLAFLPLDKETGELLHGRKLRPFITLHGSLAEEGASPSESWPANLTETLELVQSGSLPPSTFRESSFVQFLPSMLAASSGSVAILPDYHGFGESEIDRSYMWPEGYKQSTIVSWLHVREYFLEYYPCTQLDMTAVTLQGFEDGAFGAVFAAQGFRRFKTEVLTVFSGTGIMDLDTMISNAISSVNAGESVRGRKIEMLEMAAFSFSTGNPNLSNTNAGQDLVSEESRQAIMDKYSRSSNGTVELSGGELAFLNPELLAYYTDALENGVQSPCKANLTGTEWFSMVGALCEAIANASTWPTLLGETEYQWIQPIEFCYGEEDPVVAPAQVEAIIDSVELAIFYDGPIGETGDTLKPLGSKHSQIMSICGISSGLFYVLQGHIPDKETDHPNYMLPLDDDLASRCAVTTQTTPAPYVEGAPTKAPAEAPDSEDSDDESKDDVVEGAPTKAPAEAPDESEQEGSAAVLIAGTSHHYSICLSALAVLAAVCL
jgi:hypothetical protein